MGRRVWWAVLLLLVGIGLRERPGPGWAAEHTPTPEAPAATPTVTPERAAPIGITSPGFGAVLQGTVVIHGRPRAPHATRAVLELGYGPEGPWFVLVQWAPPPDPGPLWTWDTTTVADGAYWLRLRVDLDDGSALTYALPVQVRNHSPAGPTPTARVGPAPRPAQPTAAAATLTPSPTPWPTPPARPPAAVNPAALGWADWTRAVRLAGALAGLGVAWFTLRTRRR